MSTEPPRAGLFIENARSTVLNPGGVAGESIS